jgi:hypothetical protein
MEDWKKLKKSIKCATCTNHNSRSNKQMIKREKNPIYCGNRQFYYNIHSPHKGIGGRNKMMKQ